MTSSVYVGDYHFNLCAASLLRKEKTSKDYFYNCDQRHRTLRYTLHEIENLNSLDDLRSVAYESIILTNPDSSNLVSLLTERDLVNFTAIDYHAYPVLELRSALEFVMGTPFFADETITRFYWDLRAPDIHESWGEDGFDYATLEEVIGHVQPGRILDVGCGSGRLFNLYSRLNVREVVGQDISPAALQIAAARNLPNVVLFPGKIEELSYEPKHFDLIVSNRVMAAIPARDIGPFLDTICRLGKYIYINELLPEDEHDQEKCPYFIAHDYASLFRERGYQIDRSGDIDYKIVESGRIVKQKWFLYLHPLSRPSAR